MEANDEKLNGILQFAKRLTEEGHYAADKIQKKAENIAERRENNRYGRRRCFDDESKCVAMFSVHPANDDYLWGDYLIASSTLAPAVSYVLVVSAICTK